MIGILKGDGGYFLPRIPFTGPETISDNMTKENILAHLSRPLDDCSGLKICSAATADLENLDRNTLESILGPRELIDCRQRFRHEGRRVEWLAGRVAGKHAVGRLLGDATLGFPEGNQLEILSDERGAPYYAGPWKFGAGRLPELSIAHTDGMAVAAAGNMGKGLYPGIDIELKDRRLSARVIGEVYSPGEMDFLDGLEEPEKGYWRLRLWCAREASAKSLRMGLVGLTRHFRAEEIDFETGTVYVAVSGLPKDRTSFGNKCTIPVKTLLHDSYILAVSLTR